MINQDEPQKKKNKGESQHNKKLLATRGPFLELGS